MRNNATTNLITVSENRRGGQERDGEYLTALDAILNGDDSSLWDKFFD